MTERHRVTEHRRVWRMVFVRNLLKRILPIQLRADVAIRSRFRYESVISPYRCKPPYEHPHFWKYLLSFINGADLPRPIIEQFAEIAEMKCVTTMCF